MQHRYLDRVGAAATRDPVTASRAIRWAAPVPRKCPRGDTTMTSVAARPLASVTEATATISAATSPLPAR